MRWRRRGGRKGDGEAQREMWSADGQIMDAQAMDGQCAGCPEGHCCLHLLRPGAKARVHGVQAGRKARCRLASLGLIQGSHLQVVANPGIGPLLLSVGESRLMVERGIAAKVLVQQV